MRDKFIKDSLDCGINKAKHIPNSQVPPDGGGTIAEDYLEGRLNLHIHIRFSDEEFCAIFDRNSEIRCFRDVIDKSAKLDSGNDLSSEQDVSMFINVAQLVENPKVLAGATRCARLKRIYDTDYCVADPHELSALLFVVLGLGVEDGKLIPDVGAISSRQDQLPEEMVEGAPIVVKHLPNSHTDIIRHRGNVLEAIDLISRSVVNIFGDNIGFGVTEGRHISVKRIALFSGPVEFSHRTIKGGHNDTLQKTQQTPKGHEIPVPTKEDVFSVLEKATKSIKEKPLTTRRRPKK